MKRLAWLSLLFSCSVAFGQSQVAEVPVEDSAIVREALDLAQELERTERPYAVGSAGEMSPVSEELVLFLPRITGYLESNPEDVEALIAAARLERLAARPAEIVAVPDLMRAHELLGRALDLDPENAAAHYWTSRLYGEQVLSSDSRLRFEPVDVEAAIDFGSRAVDLDPQNLVYREMLALLLAENDRPIRAMETLEAVEATQHPIYILLHDSTSLPIPQRAVRSRLSNEEIQFAQDRQIFDRYEELRSWVWILEGGAALVEEFYAALWPDFELFRTKEYDMGSGVRARSYRQYFKLGGDGWSPVPGGEDPPREKDFLVEGVTLKVEEMVAFPRPLLAPIVPEELLQGPPGRTFTMLWFTNHRFFPEALYPSRPSPLEPDSDSTEDGGTAPDQPPESPPVEDDREPKPDQRIDR